MVQGWPRGFRIYLPNLGEDQLICPGVMPRRQKASRDVEDTNGLSQISIESLSDREDYTSFVGGWNFCEGLPMRYRRTHSRRYLMRNIFLNFAKICLGDEMIITDSFK
jgi:hypothetical protein